MKTHRFLLFAGGGSFYGGWEDLICSAATREQAEQDAITALKSGDYVWYHIVDLEKAEIIKRGKRA